MCAKALWSNMPGVFEGEEGNQCDGSRVSRVDEAAGWGGGGK